jgi:mannose-1-phosphate guanylyltransferase
MDRGFEQWPNRAAIILAGGEGSRLKSLTSWIGGEDIPKQFCQLLSDKTLLDQTRDRLRLTVDPARTLIVVTQAHDRFYRRLLADLSSSNIVVQPENRGTAPAILYALLRATKLAPRASVAVFPCDHYVSDDALFMHHVELAFQVVASRPDLIVLLGIIPDHPEPNYGWIDPSNPLIVDGTPLFRVRRFWEKPGRAAAQNLQREGCLWNSLVFVGHPSTLMLAIMRAAPGLCSAFGSLRPVLAASAEEEVAKRLYRNLTRVDFSIEVLERCPQGLTVLPVCGVDWSDLGEAGRLLEIIQNTGVKPPWYGSTSLDLAGRLQMLAQNSPTNEVCHEEAPARRRVGNDYERTR